MEGARRRKLGNYQDNEDVDRISDLPDPILAHVLSFLPMKLAVRTSLLSKRWMNLWIDLPVFDFDWDFESWIGSGANYARKKVAFKTFVNKVLLLNSASHIVRCRFANLRDFDSADINAWINAVCTNQVREITVLNSVIDIGFPFKLFTLDSLSSLTLSWLYIKYTPNLVHFRLPNLKTLLLCEISCFNDNFFNRLVAGCHAIRKLAIISCHFSCMEIHSSTLNSLYMADMGWKILQTVILEAPYLKRLSFDHVNLYYKSRHKPSLTEAYIYSSVSSHELLKGVSETTTLHLDYYGTLSEINVPQFQNLKCLKLKVYCANKLGFIHGMVNHCPNLQNFVLHFDCRVYNRDWTVPHCVPQCLLSSLKVFELCAYDLLKSDVDILKYFLKNGRVLEEMKLKDFKKGPDNKSGILKRLSMPHRASSACKVTFTSARAL